MIDFNNYLFRPHRLGKIMGGAPKPLTELQEETYQSLLQRHYEHSKGLTIRQTEEYARLKRKLNDPSKNLTEIQKKKLFDFMLIHESNSKALSLNQIEALGDLSRKRKSKIHINDSAKTHLKELVNESLFNRSKSIQGNQLDKGIEKEEESISLYSKVTGKLFLKNKERRQNDYSNGECDNNQGKIKDFKTSWVYSTFPLNETKITNSIEEWQLDNYMDLFDNKTGSQLIKCLVDTPHRIIESELLKLNYHNDIMDGNGDIVNNQIPLVVEEISQHIFTNKGLCDFCHQSSSIKLDWFTDFVEIPDELRVKVFEHEYCPIRNKQFKDMIVLSRVYMNSILEDMGGEILKLKG